MIIRPIEPTDFEAIDQLIYESFSHSEHGYDNEVALVHALRKEARYRNDFECVAIRDHRIVGYGLLSEAMIAESTGVVLAPLAVLPETQRQGVGTALLLALEQQAQQLRYPFLSILGDPSYYSQFDYLPASHFNIYAPFEVPDEAFMIKALQDSTLPTGTLLYSKAFNEVIE